MSVRPSPLTLCLCAFALVAAAPRSPNLLRNAVTPVLTLEEGKTIALRGTSDGQPVEADIILSKDGLLESISVRQDGKALRLPASALAGLTGAQRAWMEERGAQTTLVIEGTSEAKDWRLALQFHDDQLWLRRLSREGVAQDSFVYHDRKDMAPQPEQRRAFHNRGFNRLTPQ